MGKLLDDGNTLYKKQRLQESTQRFQYALKKFPPAEDYGGAEYQSAFQHLRIHLTLNLARCKRKMGVNICYFFFDKREGLNLNLWIGFERSHYDCDRSSNVETGFL